MEEQGQKRSVEAAGRSRGKDKDQLCSQNGGVTWVGAIHRGPPVDGGREQPLESCLCARAVTVS